jgi:lipid-A-disaccharide synthase
MPPHIMIIAGEPSGERLGAELFSAMRSLIPSIQASGVGGEAMQGQGISSLIPLQDVAVMGIAEIIPKLAKIRQAVLTVERHAAVIKPDVLVVIDSLDFTHAVAKAVKQVSPSTRIIRYVAPKLWAWRPKRAEKLKGLYDDLLTLFPFEPAFFKKFGIQSTFVGHPVVNRLDSAMAEKESPKKSLNTIALLAGSRSSEVNALLPLFLEVAKRLQKHNPALTFLLPTVPSVEMLVRRLLVRYQGSLRLEVITQDHQRFQALKESTCALAASGTISLELMVASTPSLIAYHVNWMTAYIAKHLISMKSALGLKENYATLLNIMLNQEIMPEFIQEKCTVDLLEKGMLTLLNSPQQQQMQKDAFIQGLNLLKSPTGQPPALFAAEHILKGTSLL